MEAPWGATLDGRKVLCKGITEVHALKRIQVQRPVFLCLVLLLAGGGLMMLVLSRFTRLYLV